MSEWQRYGGDTGVRHIFTFKNSGDELIGSWQGTRRGKFGPNGVVISDGTRYEFSLTAALRELTALDHGTEVRLVFEGWGQHDAGREYKKIEIYTRRLNSNDFC